MLVKTNRYMKMHGETIKRKTKDSAPNDKQHSAPNDKQHSAPNDKQHSLTSICS